MSDNKIKHSPRFLLESVIKQAFIDSGIPYDVRQLNEVVGKVMEWSEEKDKEIEELEKENRKVNMQLVHSDQRIKEFEKQVRELKDEIFNIKNPF